MGTKMDGQQTSFGNLEVNDWFQWGELTFVKSSKNHGQCVEDDSQSQMFHDAAPVTMVVDEPKAK
jgi:hypothetical protein